MSFIASFLGNSFTFKEDTTNMFKVLAREIAEKRVENVSHKKMGLAFVISGYMMTDSP